MAGLAMSGSSRLRIRKRRSLLRERFRGNGELFEAGWIDRRSRRKTNAGSQVIDARHAARGRATAAKTRAVRAPAASTRWRWRPPEAAWASSPSIERMALGDAIDLETAYAEGRFLAPITHPDPAHLHLTGTGLTHLGSAATRDRHAQEALRRRGNAHRFDEDVPHGP